MWKRKLLIIYLSITEGKMFLLKTSNIKDKILIPQMSNTIDKMQASTIRGKVLVSHVGGWGWVGEYCGS